MAALIPHLALSHGQVMWCLAGGRAPAPPLPARVRYLRTLGIPFFDSEKKGGKGIRILYNFYEFIELGIATSALRQQVAPRQVERLVAGRTKYKRVYRAAYQELAATPGEFQGDPYTISMFSPDYMIQFFDRYSEKADTIGLAAPDSTSEWQFGDLAADVDGEVQVTIQLKSLMLHLLKLAAVAPQTKPGPKG